LAIVSMIDDINGLKPMIRLIIQFLTAILAFIFLGGLRHLIMPQININYDFLVYPAAIRADITPWAPATIDTATVRT